MLKTKFEFQSDNTMTEEQSKRYDDFLKKHKPKGLSYEEVLLKQFLDREKKKEGKKC